MPRRFKKQYADLYDNPQALFAGCETLLWPNGEKVIWIRSGNNAISIKASNGPAGLSVTIGRFVGGAPLTMTGNDHPDYNQIPQVDCAEVSVTQYHATQWAQDYKRWYSDSSKYPYPKTSPPPSLTS